ncbi:adenylate/guanylate cyclase domain-containing protein [Nocardioides sp. GXQ0305]|uniref:adenylate/guanylate cyclase domain-containing protein n=1 Tax=Nocardioides sp. GXQ0305 TaxID=3423912 RepID=UPI003D7DB4CD
MTMAADDGDDVRPGAVRDPHALERAVLGADPTLTAAEISERTGVPVDRLRRLWWALGFPEHGTAVAFTPDDVEAVSTLDAMVEGGAIDDDISVMMTRALGQSMARLADWEVATLAHRVEELERSDAATGSRTGQALRLLDELNPAFERLVVYAWRRHLAAALARIEALGARADDIHTTQVSVGFADIVGFTALSNELPRDRIGDIVEIFESRCADVVAGQRGRIIKSLGDSVLFVSADPVAAYDIAEGIIRVVGRDPRMPEVRVGLASGDVVMRLGDVFGPPVNLASRLTAVARRNRIIIDQATADLLPGDQFETRRLPARPVRGFGLVEPLTVRRH